MAGLEGRTLARYELRELVGKGGMADVYTGYDTHFERIVAVKVFKRDDEELLRRFIREARLMASLHHPNLMPVYDAGEYVLDGIAWYYIVMPYMDAGTLRSQTKQGPLALDEACRYLRDIASALDYVHAQGIIHRDIKASNVLLDHEGRCYLSDFGIARTLSDATQMTTTGSVLGTVDYVAPELFEEKRKADARSDLYSLGILLYEMVTGQLPFSAENQLAVVAMHMNKQPPSPRVLAPNISPATERVILRALEKRPELRYANATEFASTFCRSLKANASGEQWPVDVLQGEDYRTSASAATASTQVARPIRSGVSASVGASSLEHTSAGYASATYAGGTRVTTSNPRLRKRRSSASTRGRIVAVMAAIFLLVVVGGPVIFAVHNAQLKGGVGGNAATSTAMAQGLAATSTPAMNATANLTATAQAVATRATQQAVDATATVMASQTAVALSQATATAGVILTATSGAPTYADTLTDVNNPATSQAGWDQSKNCVFLQDGYHVFVRKNVIGLGQLKGCIEQNNSYTNMAISVDMKIRQGHTGGIFFRTTTSLASLLSYSGYLFEVDSQGKYKISRSNNFSTGNGNQVLQTDTISTGFHPGYNATNTLQVIAQGSNLSFYINGVYLKPGNGTTFQDETFASGNIAFLATTSTLGSATADVVYTNLKVFALS